MKNTLLKVFVVVSLACCLSIASLIAHAESPQGDEGSSATPLRPEDVPAPLKEWIDWALRGQGEKLCPFLNGLGDERVCAWGSPLILSLNDIGGTFSQQWRLFQDGFVPLPGNEERWPVAVNADGSPAAVIAIDGAPSLFLKKGDHIVSGVFAWDALPESLPIPPDIGVIALSIRNAPVALPNRDDMGHLWLGREEGTDASGESLQVRVSRLMNDGVPFELTTHLDFDVSGKGREVSFQNLLPAGFIPMQLKSQIPARLDPSGVLRVQLRPGSWGIDIVARHVGPVETLAFPPREEDSGAAALPDEEVWVYEAHREFRVASIEGAVSVDPKQTMVPEAWKNLPAYRVAKGETIRFVESMRGDTGAAPDDIRLARNLWLDFDGGGYTQSDTLTGQIKKRWRMEMNPPVALGRVASSGNDLLITRIPGSDREGVELRHGDLELLADSRIDGRRFSIPAIGWDSDMQRARTMLHIGPGWRLFAVLGADHVSTAWINQWNLLNIFLVLILSLAFAKLWGVRWGVAALVAFALTFPELDAPKGVWCALLAFTAIARLRLSGWLKGVVSWARIASIAALLIIAIPFAVDEIRTALYPSIEKLPVSDGLLLSEPRPPPAPAGLPEEAAPMDRDDLAVQAEEGMETESGAKQEMKMKVLPSKLAKRAAGKYSSSGQMQQQQQMLLNVPNAKVQTGPGVPRWSWSRHELSWSGPVDATQKLRLFLIPPWLNLVLAFVRVFALAALVLCAIGFPGTFWPPWMRRHIIPTASAALIACLLFASMPSLATAAEFPPAELLDDLALRMTAPPECSPHCADIPRLRVEADASTLRLRVEIDTAWRTAVPLPGFSPSWSPARVSVDGRAFAAMSRGDDGLVWIETGPGVHQVIIEGSVAGVQRLTIPLPLNPRRVEQGLSGWTMEGLRENGRTDGNLELVRTEKSSALADQASWTSELEPFVSVEREIVLGLDWRMKTSVKRLTPPGSAVILEVPLIAGEAVTSAGITVKDGRALVSMAPQATELSWESTLAATPTLVLTAPEVQDWIEVWRLNASPIWHVEMEGIPTIHQQDSSGLWLPEWHPWPGETVTLAISQPEAVPGQTLTIDESSLIVTPGIRSTETELRFSARSSLGGQHTVRLPKDAELKSVAIDGVDQPARQTEQSVVLPIVPGAQRFTIRWMEDGGLSALFRTPDVDLGAPNVNASIQIVMPRDRWIFFLGGPKLGPAVLVWGIVVVLALLSFGLARSGFTPLKMHHWFLLGLGLTQVSVAAAAVVFAWFLILEWRRRRPMPQPFVFDLVQILLILWSMAALGTLVASLYQGLLDVPDMQITGNGSIATSLNWFVDRSPATLARAWVFSLPLFCFRIAMLGWAIWLALAFIGWIRWAWQCFSSEETWKRMRTIVKTP